MLNVQKKMLRIGDDRTETSIEYHSYGAVDKEEIIEELLQYQEEMKENYRRMIMDLKKDLANYQYLATEIQESMLSRITELKEKIRRKKEQEKFASRIKRKTKRQ